MKLPPLGWMHFVQGWLWIASMAFWIAAPRVDAASCPAPCNLVLHDGPSTRRVAIRWDAPTNPPVREYIVYRNGYEIDRMDPANFGFLGPFKEDLHMLPGHSYTYQVAAVFTNGALSGLSNPLNVTALAATPRTGTNQIVTVLLRFADFPDTPENDPEIEALKASFRRMIYSLPEPYRDALVLTELEGFTQKELAGRLGISLSGAKSRVQRAREQLKEMLEECCTFEFDLRGKVIDCTPRPSGGCKACQKRSGLH